MTNKTTSDDDENDDEQVDIRAVLAWLKATVLTYLGRARSAVEQSIDEVAPQLRGTFSGVSVPSGALKPLALAAVLLFAAFAMPAAPFGADPVANGSDPVTGTTYDALGDSEFHDVVADRLDSAEPEAPPAPETVRASAGSQTMSVKTTIRDGEPAIVLEDDRTHKGRWVAIDTSWFQEHLGEVPQVAHIDHETEGSYTSPIQARGGEAAFYVEEFSQNTIIFEGELTVTADPATDGDSISYEAPNGGDDLSINLTGVNSTDKKSVTDVLSDSEGLSINIGGQSSPVNETIVFEGKSQTTAESVTGTTTRADDVSLTVVGNKDPKNAVLSVSNTQNSEWVQNSKFADLYKELQASETWSFSVSSSVDRIGIDHRSISSASADGADVDIYVDGNLYHSRTIPNQGGDTEYVDISSQHVDSVTVEHTGGSSIDIDAVSVRKVGESSVSATIDGNTYNFGSGGQKSVVLSQNTDTIDFSANLPADFGYTLEYDAITKTENPSVSVGGATVATYSGTLSENETVTRKVDLSLGSQTLNASVGGNVGVAASWTEVSQTVDPVVELNGNAASYSGTLSEGETVSVDANDSWITEGTNEIDIVVGNGSVPAGSPVPQVGLKVEHDVSESRTIDYSAEAFSERYSVSKTWAENTSNATLTIPWASDNVVAMRDLNVEYRDGGVEPSPRPTPSYEFVDGSVVVELGDVEAGWNTTVEANGSKVQVEGADLEVVEPTDQGEDLNTTVRLNNPSDDVYIGVGATDQGQHLHYLANASWSNEESSRITASGTNELRIPDAPDKGETNLRTLPIAFDVNSGAVDVDVPDGRLDESEPVYRIGPGDQVGDSYDVTFVEAEDAQPYVLYDETDEIVLDQGLASSPLTLSATEPEEPHVVQFREDDGSVSSSGDGGLSGTGGGVGPMVTNSRPFSALGDLVPGPGVIVALLAGLVGLTVVSRRTGLFDEGTRSDAVADATRDVGSRLAGLVGQVLRNELVVAAMLLGAGVWLLSTGVFTASERLIVALGSVPIAMFLVLRQFDAFDIRVWAGSTAVIGFLGAQRLAPEVFATVAKEAGIFVVVGVVLLGWRALSAWREEASTPDQVTRLEISAEENEDD